MASPASQRRKPLKEQKFFDEANTIIATAAPLTPAIINQGS